MQFSKDDLPTVMPRIFDPSLKFDEETILQGLQNSKEKFCSAKKASNESVVIDIPEPKTSVVTVIVKYKYHMLAVMIAILLIFFSYKVYKKYFAESSKTVDKDANQAITASEDIEAIKSQPQPQTQQQPQAQERKQQVISQQEQSQSEESQSQSQSQSEALEYLNKYISDNDSECEWSEESIASEQVPADTVEAQMETESLDNVLADDSQSSIPDLVEWGGSQAESDTSKGALDIFNKYN